jgi:hypothetical protein
MMRVVSCGLVWPVSQVVDPKRRIAAGLRGGDRTSARTIVGKPGIMRRRAESAIAARRASHREERAQQVARFALTDAANDFRAVMGG